MGRTPSMWIRRNLGESAKYLRPTPEERVTLRQQERERMEHVFTERAQGKAYRCAPCGYWNERDVMQTDKGLRCPACGSPIHVVRLFATCPRCGKEHNVSYVAERCNVADGNPDDYLPSISAKVICPDCERVGGKVPSRYRKGNLAVATRKESISEEEQ